MEYIYIDDKGGSEKDDDSVEGVAFKMRLAALRDKKKDCTEKCNYNNF